MAAKKFRYEYGQRQKKDVKKEIPGPAKRGKWKYSYQQPVPVEKIRPAENQKPEKIGKRTEKKISEIQKPRKGYKFTPKFIIYEKRRQIAAASVIIIFIIDAIILFPLLFPPIAVTTEIKRGLAAEYFQTLALEGNATASGFVKALDLNFTELPVGIDPGHFSARFFGVLLIMQDGDYSFELASRDGARLYIDGQLVIDTWSNAGNSSGFAFLKLSRLGHYIEADYRNFNGEGFLRLYYWSDPLNITRQPVPEKLFKRYEQVP